MCEVVRRCPLVPCSFYDRQKCTFDGCQGSPCVSTLRHWHWSTVNNLFTYLHYNIVN